MPQASRDTQVCSLESLGGRSPSTGVGPDDDENRPLGSRSTTGGKVRGERLKVKGSCGQPLSEVARSLFKELSRPPGRRHEPLVSGLSPLAFPQRAAGPSSGSPIGPLG